jgi:hypothetical protein
MKTRCIQTPLYPLPSKHNNVEEIKKIICSVSAEKLFLEWYLDQKCLKMNCTKKKIQTIQRPTD